METQKSLPGKNKLALVRHGSSRITSHQAVLRLVIRLQVKKKWYVELRKIGGWHITSLVKQLEVW